MKKLIAIYIFLHTSVVCFAQDMPFGKLDSLSTVISNIQFSANNYGYMENDKIYTISFPEENFKVFTHDLLASHAVYKMNNGKETLELTENVDITKANHIVYGTVNDELLYMRLYFPENYLKTKVLENGEIVDFLHPKYIQFFKEVNEKKELTPTFVLLFWELMKATGKISENEFLQERKDWDNLKLEKYNEKYKYQLQLIEGSKSSAKEKVSEKATAENNAEEMYDVGLSYQIKKNYEEAITWYKKAAEKGNDKAMYAIGEIYYSNLISLGQNSTNNTQSNNVKPKRGMLSMTVTNPVVEKLSAASKENYEEAFIWYNKAAALENVDAYYKLGVMNENGFGTQQNYPEAFRWYLKAAENQNDMSMLRLAYFYKEGLGVEKDKNLSKSWYRKAQETHNLLKD